jgi:hypothetical protein
MCAISDRWLDHRRMAVKTGLYSVAVRSNHLTDDELDILEEAIAAVRGGP